MKLRLDSESARRAQLHLAYVHKGPERLPGLVRDAVLTGLLSRGIEGELRAALAGGAAAVQPFVPASVQLGDALTQGVEPSFDGLAGRAKRAARRFAEALGVAEQDVYHAAMLVGLRRLTPRSEIPGEYDPPVGPAMLEKTP